MLKLRSRCQPGLGCCLGMGREGLSFNSSLLLLLLYCVRRWQCTQGFAYGGQHSTTQLSYTPTVGQTLSRQVLYHRVKSYLLLPPGESKQVLYR